MAGLPKNKIHENEYYLLPHFAFQRHGIGWAAFAGRVAIAVFVVGESRGFFPIASGREVNRAKAAGMLTKATKYLAERAEGIKVLL